ncbi:hypothetical protein V6N13_062124 [Hibiscus sabdariffa]
MGLQGLVSKERKELVVIGVTVDDDDVVALKLCCSQSDASVSGWTETQSQRASFIESTLDSHCGRTRLIQPGTLTAIYGAMTRPNSGITATQAKLVC